VFASDVSACKNSVDCDIHSDAQFLNCMNRVLKTVFGPKRDEWTGEWRKLHNEELNDLYSVPNIVRVVKSRDE
jgi:hypothetical protein